MEITFRTTFQAEYRIVEELTREAFWDIYTPKSDEHYLVHIIRQSKDYIPELDIVAELNGEIIGHIIYTPSAVVASDGTVFPTVTFGPVSIKPKFQNKGFGSALIRYSLEHARKLGHKAVIIFGDPKYYERFGFYNCKEKSITDSEGRFPYPMVVLELLENALEGISGKFKDSAVFNIDPDEVEAFDKSFPPRESHRTPSQDLFEENIKKFL